ncbi:unnamed protein product [Rotaria magnacalcarata]
MVFDKIVVTSSSSVVGCTESTISVERKVPGFPATELRMFDTAGLSESSEGKVTTGAAFIKLVKTLYEVQDGIHLLICVARKGRLSGQAFKSNYIVFVDKICEHRVPCVLVITHCDEDDELDSFWTANKDMISEKLKLKFEDGVSVTTKKTGKNACLEDYQLSRKNLLNAIEQHALEKPWKMDSFQRTVVVFFKTVWNSIAERVNFLTTVAVRDDLMKMFETLGSDRTTAIQEANQLYEQLKAA